MLLPYFKVHSGKLDAFRKLCERFVEKTSQEPKCINYGFNFDGDQIRGYEVFSDAEGLIAHLGNVGPLFQEALTIADVSLDVTGPEQELVKLRPALVNFNPQFFVLEYGFRR